MDALLERWQAAVVAYRPGDARAAGAELLGRWAEPHRRYHDLRHLQEVLDRLADAPPEVVLAAFWHDAVYDPRATDSEERSAVLAADVLAPLGLPAPAVAEVVRLVRLTVTHAPEAGDRAGELLCDVDLAVLASGPERYADYVAGVRAEYAHLSDDAFRTGRAAVLRALLDRPTLFSPAAAHLEAPARANITAELAGLADPPP